MDEKARKRLVNIAWKQLEAFIKGWQKDTYKWNNEIDIQVDLASRIKTAYKKLKKDTQWAKYKGVVNGFEKGQIYSRIYCEPKTFYEYAKNKRDICRPDIVIYNDIENPSSPKEPWRIKQNDPILWICEIKFQPEWGNKRPNKRTNWDLRKIRYLLRQKDGTKYACWLDMSRERAKSGCGINRKILSHGRLRKYYVTLPSA